VAVEQGRLGQDARVGPYLIGTASRLILKHFRDLSRRRRRARAMPSSAEAESCDAESRLVRREKLEQVWSIVHTLSEREQSVVRLALLEARPYAEVGPRVGLSPSHLRVIVSRVRARLREGLDRVPRAHPARF
jgi:RNA polymerase sigma factor (sigma-70 family)